MDRLNQIIALLNDDTQRAELTDDQVAELESELLALFDSVRAGDVEDADPADIALLTSIADACDAVRAEAEARFAAAAAEQAEQAEREAEAEQLAQRVRPTLADDDSDDDAGGDATADDDSSDSDAGEGEGDDDSGEGDATGDVVDPAAEPVTAGSRVPSLASVAARRPAGNAPTSARTRAPAAIRSLSEGGREVSIGELARIMIERRDDFGAFDGEGEAKVRLGRISLDFPTERHLSDADGITVNNAKIDQLVAGALDPANWTDSIVASGGFMAPTPADYEVPVISGAQRPVRDSLPRMTADRGGIRFVTPPNLSQILTTGATNAAIGTWTNATDLSPGGTIKGTQSISGATIVEVLVEAIYRSLQFGNFGARAFPEWVSAWIELAAAAWARTAETRNLDAIDANTTKVTTVQLFGTTRDLLAYVIQLSTAERNRQRMDPTARLRVYLPAWVVGSMQMDQLREGYNDSGLKVIDESTIRGWFATFNINVTFYEDQRTGSGQIVSAQGSGNDMRDLPLTCEWYLFHEGAYVHLDAGTLDLGLVRDATLNQTNDFKIFAETFENVAYRGVFSYRVRSAICPNGAGQLALAKEGTTCAAS